MGTDGNDNDEFGGGEPGWKLGGNLILKTRMRNVKGTRGLGENAGEMQT